MIQIKKPKRWENILYKWTIQSAVNQERPRVAENYAEVVNNNGNIVTQSLESVKDALFTERENIN